MTLAFIAFYGMCCGMFLASKALTVIAERDEARRDRDHYRDRLLNLEHDHHAFLMAVVERGTGTATKAGEAK